MKTLRLCSITLAAAAVLASAAEARPWSVHKVASPGPSLSRGVDVQPNGRAAVLIQRRAGASNRLELRIGRTTRLLDQGPHSFLSTDVQHDARGRLVVVWRRIAAGAIQAFGWTPRGGRQQVSSVRKSVSHLSLSVAPPGGAALVYSSPEGVFLARASSGRGFQPPAAVAGPSVLAAQPRVAVSSGGRVVVAWSDGRRILVRSAIGAAPLVAAQPVSLRPAAAGNTLLPGVPEVVITNGGRAVVAVSSSELRGSSPAPDQTPVVADRRVEAFDWPRTAPRPSAAATLSRGASAGDADIVAQGGSAVIAWTQRPQGAPRSLWTTRWTRAGLQRPNVYDTRMLDLPVLLTPAPRGAVDAFYSTAQRWFTVRLNAAGLYRGTSTVTAPGIQVPLIDAAAAGPHAAATWTVRNPGTFVQLARPAR